MDIDQHWIHSTRTQVIKIIKDLSDARSHLCHSVPKSKHVGATSELATAIEQNIDALRLGVDETIKMCAELADTLKKSMTDPNALSLSVSANTGYVLTPFQRRLVREGVVELPSLPQYVTKVEKRMPKIVPFTLKKRQFKHRHPTKENIPL